MMWLPGLRKFLEYKQAIALKKVWPWNKINLWHLLPFLLLLVWSISEPIGPSSWSYTLTRPTDPFTTVVTTLHSDHQTRTTHTHMHTIPRALAVCEGEAPVCEPEPQQGWRLGRWISLFFPHGVKMEGIPPVVSKRLTMYSYIYAHIFILTYIHLYIHTYMHTCMRSYISYIYTYIHTYIYSYMYSCIHTCIHVYIHTYIYTVTYPLIYYSTPDATTQVYCTGTWRTLPPSLSPRFLVAHIHAYTHMHVHIFYICTYTNAQTQTYHISNKYTRTHHDNAYLDSRELCLLPLYKFKRICMLWQYETFIGDHLGLASTHGVLLTRTILHTQTPN